MDNQTRDEKKPRRRNRKAAPAELLDMLCDEDMPAYQSALQEAVTKFQQRPEAAGLSPQAIALALVSMDPRVPRTVSAWCRVADVGRAAYYAWRHDARWVLFREYLARQVSSKDLLGDIFGALREGIRKGDPRMVRLAAEINGLLVAPAGNQNTQETPEERMKRLRAQQAVGGTSEEPAS